MKKRKDLTRRVVGMAALAILTGLLGATRARAAAIPDFGYAPAISSVTLPANMAGTTYQVPLFLQAKTTAGTALLGSGSENGVFSLGVAMSLAGSAKTGGTTIAGYAANTADFGGLSFPATVTSTSITNDSESVSAGSKSGVNFGNTAGGTMTNPVANNEIYIGTATLTVGAAGSSTTFNIAAIDPTNGGFSTTFKNQYDLDNQALNSGGPTYNGVGTSTAPFTIAVAAAPEPAGIGLVAIAGLAALRRRRTVAQRR